MNPPNNDEQPNASLPIPMGSQPTPPVISADSARSSGLPPLGSTYAQSPPLATSPPPVLGESSTVASDTTQGVVPITADDSDLIEKEWVDKAKSIVQANLENPYEQSRELTNLKAEYMKKRYNKDIRLGE
jgi:hypothetical protein